MTDRERRFAKETSLLLQPRCDPVVLVLGLILCCTVFFTLPNVIPKSPTDNETDNQTTDRKSISQWMTFFPETGKQATTAAEQKQGLSNGIIAQALILNATFNTIWPVKQLQSSIHEQNATSALLDCVPPTQLGLLCDPRCLSVDQRMNESFVSRKPVFAKISHALCLQTTDRLSTRALACRRRFRKAVDFPNCRPFPQPSMPEFVKSEDIPRQKVLSLPKTPTFRESWRAVRCPISADPPLQIEECEGGEKLNPVPCRLTALVHELSDDIPEAPKDSKSTPPSCCNCASPTYQLVAQFGFNASCPSRGSWLTVSTHQRIFTCGLDTDDFSDANQCLVQKAVQAQRSLVYVYQTHSMASVDQNAASFSSSETSTSACEILYWSPRKRASSSSAAASDDVFIIWIVLIFCFLLLLAYCVVRLRQAARAQAEDRIAAAPN